MIIKFLLQPIDVIIRVDKCKDIKDLTASKVLETKNTLKATTKG